MIMHVQQFLIRDVDSYKRASQNFAQSLLQIIIVKARMHMTSNLLVKCSGSGSKMFCVSKNMLANNFSLRENWVEKKSKP